MIAAQDIGAGLNYRLMYSVRERVGMGSASQLDTIGFCVLVT
ncbi:hypothetical protein ACI394_30220 [Klebsiella pneumoniae]|jgi:hypothetical protein